jgi:hemoglobin
MTDTSKTQAIEPGVEELASTRRELFLNSAALFSAMAVASSFAAPAQAEGQKAAPPASASLYERLGGIFAIAGVVNYFSDEVVKDPIAGARSRNPRLRRWHTQQLGRLPGLKFMRTLWVADITGGPFKFSPTRPGSTPLGLENAHRNLRISPREFDAVAAVLSRSLDHFSVPAREKGEVLAAFAAHKNEVTQGFREARGNRR